MKEIYLAHIKSEHGDHFYAGETQDALVEQVASYVAKWWIDRTGQPIEHMDPDPMSAIFDYFGTVKTEKCDLSSMYLNQHTPSVHWPATCRVKAREQGWDVFFIDGDPMRPDLQRLDGAALFNSDQDAYSYVAQRAVQGDYVATQALKTIYYEGVKVYFGHGDFESEGVVENWENYHIKKLPGHIPVRLGGVIQCMHPKSVRRVQHG